MTNNIKIFDIDKNEIDLHPKAISLGNFDGIHKGHIKLMKRNIEISRKRKLVPSVLLFKENTKNILNGQKDYLTSLEDKIEVLSSLGIECFCLLDFNEDFKKISAQRFIHDILYYKLNAKSLIIGNNYYFGKDAKGNKDTLKKFEEDYGYTTEVVDFEMDNDKIINSTDIRDMIRNGQIEKANFNLGRNYKIKGKVVHGKQRGRLLNFPTANLKTSFKYVMPKFGVYFTRLKIDNKYYYSLTDIGRNPTFENEEIKIESYILDFKDNVYDKDIEIEFLEYLRPDYKFDSKEDLIKQMEKDKKKAYQLKENIEK